MILNTLDNLGKFKEKGDEGYFIGYSMSSKAFRVFNKRTRRVEENLHVEFLENKAIEKGAGPNWLFDIASLTKSMIYVPVDAGTKDATSQEVKKDVSSLRYITLPNWVHDALLESSLMESLIPTVSSPVPTACSTDSQEPSMYQMDVKSAFLYGTIDEEVYVMQPPGFQDPEFLARVYKVEKAMYVLHQDPRAWYGTLSKYLLTHGFQRGTIDQTLFIRRQRGDFILVQVYVDGIIFGSSNLQLCREFEALMHDKFQMSAMDLLTKPFDAGRFQYLVKLISMDHIHTTENVTDLLTKPFDAGRFQYLVGEHNVDFHSIVDFVEASPLSEHTVDFHSIVDFVEASPLMYALTFKPTIYVSHIRQFLSTARIETTKEGTKILATVDGIHRTVTESSLRRNLKLQDEEGISSLPDTKLFENLTL
nr:putative ribonuclease H-like domain-containing protein [Tanacetum cinerariifolium]